MNCNTLLKGKDCSCGKRHDCPIEAVYIEADACRHLKELTEKYERILLVADENTFAAAGAKTEAALENKQLSRVIFSGKKILVPNEEAVERVEASLGDSELIVGIGSGVIQDLCKYVSFQKKVPYLVVATAPSMDGYASNGAAMIMGGMKVTYPAGLPVAILADTQVLSGAPMEMIRAGYGDVIGKYSALNDWKLSRCVNGEYYCQWIVDLTEEQIQNTVSLAGGLMERREESIKALMEALVIIGILMSFAGSSRPASGSEHHLSHFFEITGIVEGTDYLPHGIDVAYSTVVTASVREKLLARPFPGQRFRLSEEALQETVKSIYGPVAEGCLKLQEKIGNYTMDRTPIYHEKEAEIRSILAEMPTAAEVESLLVAAGFSMDEFYHFYGKEKIERAVLYAKDLKDRYTVLWLYYDFFGGDQQ